MTDARIIACELKAHDQFGLIHRRQALDLGLTPRMIRYRTQSGAWEVVRHNVYRYRASPRSWHQDLFGLHLWSLGGIAAGRSAAALHGLRSFRRGPLEVCVNRSLESPPGVTIARVGPGFQLDPVWVEGVPCSTVEETIVRIAATWGARRAGVALDDALRRRMTTLEALGARVEELAVQGRNGITRTRALIDARDHRHEQVRGESENEMLPLFDGVRLPRAEVDHEIWSNGKLVAIADFAYPASRIDIEADTHSFHDSEADSERDKRRDRRLMLLGWTVLRFTRREIRQEPQKVVRDVRAHLKRRAPQLLNV